VSAGARKIIALFYLKILQLGAHRVAHIQRLLLVNVVAARTRAEFAISPLDLVEGAHSLTLALNDSRRRCVTASTGHVQLAVLGLIPSAHSEGRFLLFVSKCGDVAAGTERLVVTILTCYLLSLQFANAICRSRVVSHI